MKSIQEIRFKRGDSFVVACTVASNGQPTDITQWLINSQVRYESKLIADLNVSISTASTGDYVLRCDATDSWPIGKMQCDIEYKMANGIIVSTDTFIIVCERDITQ